MIPEPELLLIEWFIQEEKPHPESGSSSEKNSAKSL